MASDRTPVRRLEVTDGELGGRLDQIDAVMADLGLLGHGGLGGSDVHPPVHLHAVDRDQFDVAEPAGDGERDGGLPGRGRADDRHPSRPRRQRCSPSAMRW